MKTVYFAPIPPDTTASLREDLIRISEEYGMEDYVPPSCGWAQVLDMYLPDTENARQFIGRMKQVCEVRVVAEDESGANT